MANLASPLPPDRASKYAGAAARHSTQTCACIVLALLHHLNMLITCFQGVHKRLAGMACGEVRLPLRCAGDPQTPAGASTCSSFGQLLTEALPSEVQSLLKPVTQPAKSNKSRAGDNESRELNPLESLQTEKARIHGALVSYLTCGWQASNASQSYQTESRSESADSRTTVFDQPSVSRDQGEVSVSGRNAEQSSESLAQQQRQAQTVGEPQLRHVKAVIEQQQPSSSDTRVQRSRRAEAMAALEGRHHSMSPG